jgi:HAD superfamily hydrolase (TIGR01450 family)
VSDLLSPEAAFRRYEEVRGRLPGATFPAAPRHVPTLSEAADIAQGFVLDAFGVLNVGDTPIPGAVARMAELRARGKRLCVLTNAASHPRAQALEKYRALGFDFSAHEVVSSRDVAAARLGAVAPGATWGALAAEGDGFADIPARVVDAMEEPGALDGCDAILFLSTARWTPVWQARLLHALERRPRPVVVANPDLVAPREGGLSAEPGLFAHDLADRVGAELHFFGKPFSDAFLDAAARMGLAPGNLAMVGDTLHTDVLGGAAAGMRTVLVAAHGLFAGREVGGFVAASGIVPDVVVETT